MCFRRNVLGRSKVRVRVEEDPSVLRFDEASLGRRRGMLERPPCGIGEKRLCDVRPAILVGFTTLYLRRLTLGAVSAFELMIARSLSEQLLDIGGLVVDGSRVNPDDTVIAVELVTWPQFETRGAVGVDAYEMQPIAWHLQRELLHCFAVTAIEERCLASLLREQVCRVDRQHLRGRGCPQRLGQRFKSPFRDRSDGIHRNSFRIIALRSSNDAADGLMPAGG